MTLLRRVLVALLVLSLVAYPQGNTFNKVRYNGGTLQTTVDPKDWDNVLTVSPDKIGLHLKMGRI